ncbi:sulfite exporter TauE/SafE family protein [Pseudomonas profundi]|uniref:sulfite exporter TauE/SafE family protein n=1 Tax=Pseudomonas profundi TaxID=1981513 RepID=UPI00167FFEB6|nr:sulfite exporter TauE/SafE family protein [Pseudomonas profundi]
MLLDPWLWLGLFILLAYTIEAVTGFGSLVIALSLGALILPIPEMMPVVVPLNVLMTAYLVWRNHRHIYWPVLLKLILPLMLLGTAAGYALRPWLGDDLLKLLFGMLVLWFASRELLRMYRGIKITPHPLRLSRALAFGAGITHGLFASGGPLLVYAIGGIQLDKSRMRATLLVVWLTLNSCLTALFLFDGTLIPSLPRLVLYLPLLVVGVLLGEYLHHRLDEQRFRQVVYGLLVLTGVLLIFKALEGYSGSMLS